MPSDVEAKQKIRDMVSRARKKPQEDEARRNEWRGEFDRRMAALSVVVTSFDDLHEDGIFFKAVNSSQVLTLTVTFEVRAEVTPAGAARRRLPTMTLKGDIDRACVQVMIEPGHIPPTEISLNELTDERFRGFLVELCQQAVTGK